MQVILLERVAEARPNGRDRHGEATACPQLPDARQEGAARHRATPRRTSSVAGRQLEAHNLERKQDAQKAADKLDGESVMILRQAGESRQLYGSVSGRDIAEAFTKAGITLERHQIVLEHPIKALGVHDVKVALHPEVR